MHSVPQYSLPSLPLGYDKLKQALLLIPFEAEQRERD